MLIEYDDGVVRIVHLQGSIQGPNFPRDLDGDDAFVRKPGRTIGQAIFHHSAGGFYDGLKAVERIAEYAIAPPVYERDTEGKLVLRNGRRKLIGGGRGWPGVPYTFVIPARPAYEEGRLVLYRIWDDEWQTWHTGGIHNRFGVGICIGGWYASRHDLLAQHAKAQPTEEAMICADHLADYLMDRYRLKPSAETLTCHAECGKPACPGDFVENWVRVKRGDQPINILQPAREDARPLASVRQIQEALVELGYTPGTVDDRWGPLTANALRAFQASQGIRADGIFGPVSRQAMRQALARGAG
mgnify:FL=1